MAQQDDELAQLRQQSERLLRELHDDPWEDLEERTSPSIHVHLPREPQPSVPDEAAPHLSPRARLIVAVVVAILGALGARWGL